MSDPDRLGMSDDTKDSIAEEMKHGPERARGPLPDDLCECEHYRDEHGDKGCDATASSGYSCACPSFKDAE